MIYNSINLHFLKDKTSNIHLYIYISMLKKERREKEREIIKMFANKTSIIMKYLSVLILWDQPCYDTSELKVIKFLRHILLLLSKLSSKYPSSIQYWVNNSKHITLHQIWGIEFEMRLNYWHWIYLCSTTCIYHCRLRPRSRVCSFLLPMAAWTKSIVRLNIHASLVMSHF